MEEQIWYSLNGDFFNNQMEEKLHHNSLISWSLVDEILLNIDLFSM
jgi:hypothetical protein